MPLRLTLTLALLVAWPFAANAAGDGVGERPPTPTEAAAPTDATWTRMVLAGGEVALTYPLGLGLAATPQQLLTRSMIPACDQPFDYCLYLPRDQFEGTNLSSAGLRINARHDVTAEISCLLAQPPGYSDLQPGVMRGTASTSRFGDLRQGAAGSYSQGELRRLWTGHACYEFETRQVLTRYENYEPGTITQFTDADQAALTDRFDAVLSSVHLTGGQNVTWPARGTSMLEAFVKLELPMPDAALASPLLIAGQAVGNWFFEGTFPVRLIDQDGQELATGYVTAAEPWMTTEFVPFEGALKFSVREATKATLILERDNPSDLALHDASVHVPLTLVPEDNAGAAQQP